MNHLETPKYQQPVIPAKAGIQELHYATKPLDSGFRRNDGWCKNFT